MSRGTLVKSRHTAPMTRLRPNVNSLYYTGRHDVDVTTGTFESLGNRDSDIGDESGDCSDFNSDIWLEQTLAYSSDDSYEEAQYPPNDDFSDLEPDSEED